MYSQNEHATAATLILVHHKVLGLRMVDDNGGCRLFRLELEARGQVHADCFLGMEQCDNLRLVFQIGARRISKRVARAAILLVKQIGDAFGIVPGNA
jgi:hypothetical protein